MAFAGQPMIMLRTDVPAYTVAMRLVAELGFRLERQINRQLLLARRFPGDASVETGIGVYDYRRRRPWSHLSDGYDIRVSVSPGARHDEALEAEVVWGLFDEVCQRLGYPAVLDAVWLLAAWSPELGLRRFPPRTTASEDFRELWRDYALPKVADVPVPPAPVEDVLGRLYEQIVAAPEDDAPRLAYADAVAGDHPDYAELIRWQVEYSNLRRAGAPVDAQQQLRMERRERDLHGEIGPREVDLLGEDYHVRRGFVEAAVTGAERFVEWAEQIVAMVPLRMVYFTSGAAEHMAGIARLPQLAQVRGLSFWGNPIGDEGLRELLSSPYLTGLRWLSLDRTGVTPAGIEALAASEAVPQLQYVRAGLGLNPVPAFDWDGSLVQMSEPTLGPRLAEAYDRPWLRWRPKYFDQYGWDPEYHEV